MKIEILIKVSAESRGELIESFAAKYKSFRDHIESLQAHGALPAHPPIRWLLNTSAWEGPASQPSAPPVVPST